MITFAYLGADLTLLTCAFSSQRSLESGEKALGIRTMTTAEAISPPTRKLSVVDTLDDARRALSTHRRWLNRRVSTDFGLSIENDDREGVKGKEWTVSDVEDEEDTRNEHESPVSFSPTTTPAPPTSRRRKHNVVAPAPLLQNLTEIREGRGDVEAQITATRELSWALGDQQSTYKDDDTTISGREELLKELPNPKRLKMKWLSSKATVTPATSCPPSDPQSSSSQVPLHLFASPSTPTTDPPLHTKPSSPQVHTHGNPLAAWGSLSSLDKYMDSLETGTQDNKPEKIQTLAASSLSSDDENESSTSEHEENTACIESISKISLFSNPEYDLSREQLEEEQNQGMGSEGMGVDIEALQNESTATILPVSPAPEDRQSSYKAHYYSKLDQVGEGARVIEVKERSPVELESRSQRLIATKRASLSANTSSATLVAVLEDVLPCEGDTDITVSQTADYNSEPVQTDPTNTASEGIEQPSSSPQLQAVVSHEAVNGNPDAILLPENKRHNSLQTSSSRVGGQESQPEEDLSFHPRLTSTPLVPPGPEVDGQTTSERRREILQQLDLPPLKDNKGRVRNYSISVYKFVANNLRIKECIDQTTST